MNGSALRKNEYAFFGDDHHDRKSYRRRDGNMNGNPTWKDSKYGAEY